MLKQLRRIITLILCAALLCTLCMMPALADSEGQETCDHDFHVIQEGRGWFTHMEECSKCGARIEVDCVLSTHLQRRESCLNTWYCECGNAHAEAFWEHSFTEWETDDSTHTRKCVNPGCEVVESGPHDFIPSNDCTVPTYCRVCGAVNGTTNFTEHAWSAWIDTGSGTHYRYCTHGGCTARETAKHSASGNGGDTTQDIVCADCGAVIEEGASEHTWSQWTFTGDGGHARHCLDDGCHVSQGAEHRIGVDANCTSPAICADCGAYFGGKNAQKHTGGTEIRDTRGATVDSDGYTGDTYCLGCGQLLKRGTVIPALVEEHVHAYSFFHQDSVNHWYQCLCGDKTDVEPHTFENGSCTVCGARDPSYKTHTHTFGDTYSSDGTGHWLSCVECGARQSEDHSVGDWTIYELEHYGACSVCGYVESGAHTYENGHCTVCGAEDPDSGGVYTVRPDTGLVDVEDDHYNGGSSYENTSSNTQDSQKDSAYENTSSNMQDSQKDTPDDTQSTSEEENSADREEDLYADSIQRIEELHLMDDAGGNTFVPEDTFTRGRMVVLLYRLAGAPETEAVSPFTDVSADTWYSEAAAWAADQDMVKGVGEGRFDPDGLVNVQMLAKVLYNYAEKIGLSMEISEDALEGITGFDQVEPWAKDAVKWAVSAGILVPENGKLDLDSAISCALVARITDLFLTGVLV